MSEHAFVEKPFLDQLASLDWKVIDQGPGVPTDPAKSLRTSFREVILEGVFRQSLNEINRTEQGQPWLADKQISDLIEEILNQPAKSLVEANEAVLKLLYRAQVDVNEVTGEQYPNVKLIDFDHPERNHFLAINQFRIDTPGATKDFIIPDIVLFVNGLPLVVIEAKDANDFTANPMHEAFQQLMRYSDQREETKQAGLREGEPKLFFTNQLLIRTCGDRADFGAITATDEEFFYPWKDIYPEKYKQFTPPFGKPRQQEMLIQGMLPKETLLDLIRTCTVFMDVGKVRAKIIARYQQYRAVCKIIDRLRKGQTPEDRSGVIWHTQGSGKSLAMVFVIRKLRMCDDLKDYKVCLVNDRIEYTLVRSRRKTASIYIERDGKVSVLVPEKLTTRQIEDVLESKRKWIYRNLAEWQDLNARKVHRDYVNGEGFMYLGRSYRLKLVSELDVSLMLKDGYFCLQTPNGSIMDADAAFKEFYRQKGVGRIPPRVAYFQAKMDVESKTIKVFDLKHRWASCTPGGNLNFHLKCMMAPLTIIDYIVVHELAHLLYPNHTAAFWNQVDKVMPDFQERKDWLRDNGAGMDL